LTGPPDLSVYLLTASASNFLFQNGTRELTADWNTGAFGIYGLTWVNSTSLNALGFYWNGLNRTDAVANPISTASYIIDVSGSNYRMKNGTTGQFDFVSTNASAVINNAIGNLTSGSTFFKGTIVCNNSIVQKENITLCGEGAGSVLKLADNAPCDLITSAGSGGDTVCRNMFITNLWLDGNGANQASARNVINWTEPVYSHIQDCVISNFKGNGIVINRTSAGGETCWISNNRFTILDGTVGGNMIYQVGYDIVIEGNIGVGAVNGQADGMYIQGGGDKIIGNHIYAPKNYALHLVNSSLNKIIGNDFENSTKHLIFIEANGGSSSMRNEIIGNTFEDVSFAGANQYDVICENASSDVGQTIIQGNTVRQENLGFNYRNFLHQIDWTGNDLVTDNQINDYTVAFVLSGTGNIVRNNRGFTTENSVSSTNVTATTFSFNHSLAGTPTNVQCSFNTSAVSSYTWAANATGITVTVTSNNQIVVPYNAKIADINVSDTNKHTINLATNLTETRNIVSIIVRPIRQGGANSFLCYPNEGTTYTGSNGDDPQHAFIVVLAAGTNRLQYSLGEANTDWDIYCLGYVVEAYSLPAAVTCYCQATYVP
jgi:hypothetical protein